MNHSPDISKCINNAKISGHHAIIPTSNISSADFDSLPVGEKNVLTLISTKLMCVSAPAYRYESIKITAKCNRTLFTANENTVLEIGWKKYAVKSDEKNDSNLLPALTEGQIINCKASKDEHFTSPPKPYTDVIHFESRQWKYSKCKGAG